MNKFVSFLTSFLVFVGVAQEAEAQLCKPSRVMILLDRSSSMITGKVGTETKWAVAKSALSKVVTTYEGSIDFGLMIFPMPSQCGPGKVVTPVAPNNANAITSQLATPPPQSGAWTPMAQSLDVAATLKELQDSAYSNYVLLITDGWQWCSPYDAKTRFLPVNSTTNLTALGITTYVVGFGESVDTLTLNKMADAAKTKVSAGCNVAGTDPKATNNCYYQANDPTTLVNALQKIAKLIAAEKCDGQDNDCDGQVDENLARTCTNACGTGQEQCVNAQWTGCTAPQPTTEICDGKDNDCDGTVDEGCGCVDGETRACGTNQGVCTEGTQTCSAGTWGNCAGGITASEEVCDGLDNDCDNQTDEDLTRPCQSACGEGTESCANGSWGSCTAQQPSDEICDGLDNDCDGTADGPDAICENGGVCVNGICEAAPDEDGGCDCHLSFPSRSAPSLPLALFGVVALIAILALRQRRRR